MLLFEGQTRHSPGEQIRERPDLLDLLFAKVDIVSTGLSRPRVLLGGHRVHRSEDIGDSHAMIKSIDVRGIGFVVFFILQVFAVVGLQLFEKRPRLFEEFHILPVHPADVADVTRQLLDGLDECSTQVEPDLLGASSSGSLRGAVAFVDGLHVFGSSGILVGD